jgi:hypothetical protein
VIRDEEMKKSVLLTFSTFCKALKKTQQQIKSWEGNFMKLWTRLVVAGLALVLALGLGIGAAQAQTSKTKKKKKKATVVTTYGERKAAEERSKPRSYLTGTNLWGRAGLLYGDTSDVARVGQVEGSAFFTYQSLTSITVGNYSAGTNMIGIPFGAHYGAAKDVDIYASGDWRNISSSTNFPGATAGPSQSAFNINFGGKYRIAAPNVNTPDFSVGGDITIPTNTGGQVVFTPKGTCTYILESGMVLNGEFGVGISTVTYVLADAGVGIPFAEKFLAIGELGASQYGYLNSMLGLGVRANFSGTKLQALLGIPLNGYGAQIGVGIILGSM